MSSTNIKNGIYDLVVSIFEQNWLHARHVENQRIQMFGFYVLLVVAFLALSGQVIMESLKAGKDYDVPPLLLLVMIMISVVFMLFSLRLECEFHQHILLIKKMVSAYELDEYMGKPLDMWEDINMPTWLSLPLFSMFYLTMTCFFVCEWLRSYGLELAAYILFLPLVILLYVLIARSQAFIYRRIQIRLERSP